MRSPWKVDSKVIDGWTKYAVYRLRDANAPDHFENREYATEYMTDKGKALTVANRLNGKTT